VVVCGLGVILAASAALLEPRSARDAGAFLALALATWLLVALRLARLRAESEGQRAPGGGRARPTVAPAVGLGLATHLTLLRGLLISLVAGFLLIPPAGLVRWLPGLLYAGAALCDRYDGIVARRLGEASWLGARLDVEMDALGLLVAPLVGVVWGRLPAWYLLLGAAYYLFRAGVSLRGRWGLAVHPERLRRNRYARFFAGVQMILVATSLLPVLGRAVTTWAATLLMLPTLLLFARDWLIVIGRLPPGPGAAPPEIAAR
jgi:CDP-diacylglycerol--glycerol-3-phosphate 3-phosphatidyltransferase